MKGKIALLVVDIQEGLVKKHPYDEASFIGTVKRLIEDFRKSGTEVIFVRDDDGEGSELAYGVPGWQIYEEVAPLAGECVFDKRFCSAFKETKLDEYLRSGGIERLVLVGMQTEYCIDTTCRVAFELGYEIFIPEGAVTTFDNGPFKAEELNEYYYRRIWDDRFATVVSPDFVRKTLL